ncbi:ATP-dependent endonuclease [Leeuwenhoekiella polynyae]|uniref:Putative ATP-dependent endonuclease of OLD family n=1 Tax=Leeuwenhoekiella polynyae TaxID=1550906 RepID=A0A4Q0P5F6_9FLAO|nr:AAA family ATPase [Leeuwenhoekiella polynyae]RXG21266.1 putative ATP-dependent endonuclease of OLD family [Leeuwenhoekiella polynyae]
MFLENIIVVNYRSCKSLDIRFSEDIPNVFIGLNDSGKSSVLQAIDLLLSPRSKYNFYGEGNHKSDLSNSLVSEEEVRDILLGKDLPLFPFKKESTLILGKLKYQEEEAILFEELNLSNHLQWSFESNHNEEFWLAKEFYNGNTQTYLLTKEYESYSLWNENQTNLNKLIKEKSISPTDIENENGKGRFSNIEKLRSIYAALECELVWTEYNYSKNDKELFPSFSLFDWNSSLEEIISTANAIMQEEINAHLKPVRETANDSAKEAEIVINKKFGEISKIISKVAKDVEGISSRVFFDVKEKISDIMVTKTYSDGPIHLENQGEGLKRQIWFSLIKAKADTSQDSLNKFIWAFDEPETHLYPGAQREFFDILNKLSEGNVQTIISTHSTIFIDKSSLNTINSVKQKNDGYTEINYCKDITSIYSSLNVKNSDFLFYDKFLVVEGDTEQYLIPGYFGVMVPAVSVKQCHFKRYCNYI